MNTNSRRPDSQQAERERELTQTTLVHERVMLCCRLARLLHHALTGIAWPGARFSDRSRLTRALARLESDIGLARTIITVPRNKVGTTTVSGTTKAASSGEA